MRGLFSLASPAGRRARLTVLILHRVLPEVDPLFPSSMHAARFDRLCAWIREWFHVLPLEQAVLDLQRGCLPPRAAAISFDDGYADNHDVAMPILRRHGLSATFFIATGFLGGGRMWNDSIVSAVRASRRPVLELGGLGLAVPKRLPLDSIDARRRTASQLLAASKYLGPGAREAMVEHIIERAGRPPLPQDLMMDEAQVRGLRDGGMQIGAHTQTHPILAGLPRDVALQELRGSRDALERMLDEPVRVFAYPNGKPGKDYDAESVALVREAGFRVAVSTAWGAARASSVDPLQVPRFLPWDTERLRFGLRLLGNFRQEVHTC